ncbi:fasciclin domain-containing protein, partial [bacterium]|nr:fasciclin domain-containing protein [bacterium]
LNGAKATIAVAGGKVTIDKANIVKTDIVGTNGVIHVIDSVILPAAK